MDDKRPQQAKRHHILPKFYLENFTKDRKVWVLDFHTKKSYRTTPINAACIGDFYTVETVDKQEDDVIEQKFLAPLESLAQPIISKIIETKHLPTSEEWGILANFVALMYVRGPWFRQAYLETYEHFANKMASDLLSSKEVFNKAMTDFEKEMGKKATDFTYEQALQSREKVEITTKIARTFYIKEMMLEAGKLYEVFVRMTPNLFLSDFFTEARFVTSDKPIQAISRKPNPQYNNWLEDPNVELYFPLSPRICMTLNRDDRRLESPASRKRIAATNELFASSCTRILISRDHNFAWIRDNKTVSYDTGELRKLLSDSKKTQPITAIGDEEPLSKCRNDWNLLKGS